MTTFVKHIVGPFEGGMQFCLICGEVILDYRRSLWPVDQPPPSGFAEGEIYIQGKNPTSYFPGPFDEKWLEEGDTVVDCNKVPTKLEEYP